MENEKVITLESNGEKWLYHFSRLSVQQIFAAQSWFTFYNDILSNPPSSAKELKLSGGTEYLTEALSLLLLKIENDKVLPFSPEETPTLAKKFLSNAVGIYDKVKEIQTDFFLITKTSSPEQVMKAKRQMQGTATLLHYMTIGKKTLNE